jgi:hypothetical protein
MQRTLGTTHPPIQWLSGALSAEVERLGSEGPLTPCSAEVKNCEAIPPLPHMSSWRSGSLINHKDNFTLPV